MHVLWVPRLLLTLVRLHPSTETAPQRGTLCEASLDEGAYPVAAELWAIVGNDSADRIAAVAKRDLPWELVAT